MSKSMEAAIENVIESFEGNIAPDTHSHYSSLDNMGKAALRAALTQLVYEIKEEIRNEAHQ